MDYDAIIVGGGPAGLSAGIQLRQANHRVLLLDKESFGGQIMNVEWIENYPGPDERVAGAMLASEMVNEAEKRGMHLELGEVAEIEPYSGCISVTCADGRAYTSSVVILAGGLHPRKLGVPGEEKYLGKGMIHCAVCDAGLYRDQKVAVCGAGRAGLIEAMYLGNHAARVYVLEAQRGPSAGPKLQQRALADPKLEIRCGQRVVEVIGDEFVTAVRVENIADGRIEILDVHGVLVHVGFEPSTGYLGGILPLDDQGYVAVNSDMETGIPGILAAGDIRNGSPRTVAAAVSDGKTAAAAAQRILQTLKQEA